MPERYGCPMTERAPPTEDRAAHGKERLQRVLADAGVAARRVCEAMIEAGRVRVNGEVARRLPVFVDPEADSIEVDGRPLRPRGPGRPVYIMVNKPERTLVTAADEQGVGRTTVLDLVRHPGDARLFPVGRMDYYSTGLVLLTNDGEVANRLTHPRYQVPRTYEIVVRGVLTTEHVRAITAKLRIARENAAQAAGKRSRAMKGSPPDIQVVAREGDRTVLRITLRESGHGDLREILREIGVPVKKMTRVSFGPLTLEGLAIGRWRELERHEVQALRGSTKGDGMGPGGRHVAPDPGRKSKNSGRRDPKKSGAPLADAEPTEADLPTGRVTKDQLADPPRSGPTRDGGPDRTTPARPPANQPARAQPPARPEQGVRPRRIDWGA